MFRYAMQLRCSIPSTGRSSLTVSCSFVSALRANVVSTTAIPVSPLKQVAARHPLDTSPNPSEGTFGHREHPDMPFSRRPKLRVAAFEAMAFAIPMNSIDRGECIVGT